MQYSFITKFIDQSDIIDINVDEKYNTHRYNNMHNNMTYSRNMIEQYIRDETQTKIKMNG